jgi:Pentapeptide repeats (8 copies)
VHKEQLSLFIRDSWLFATLSSTRRWVEEVAELADYHVIKNLLRGFFRRRAVRVVGGVALLVVVVVLLFLILNWYVAPTKPSERKDLILAVAQILGGTALLSGLYFTWRSLQVNREGQITERFTTAIDQLGKIDDRGDKLFEIRIGGVYALDRIARESEEDYWPIMEVLCAYVRKHAPRTWLPEIQESAGDPKEDKRSDEEISRGVSKRAEVDAFNTNAPGHGRTQQDGIWFWGSREHEPADPDIQAIITVLRRRSLNVPSGPKSYLVIAPGMRAIRALDLHETNLTNANFSLTNLRNAIFFGANLKGAWLWESNLTSAQLSRANLTGASLAGADLTEALLAEADLTQARLSGANLTRANLIGADLSGADLSGVRHRHLTQEQLEQADGDEYTQLPSHLKPPAHWGVKPDEQPEADEEPEASVENYEVIAGPIRVE